MYVCMNVYVYVCPYVLLRFFIFFSLFSECFLSSEIMIR